MNRRDVFTASSVPSRAQSRVSAREKALAVGVAVATRLTFWLVTGRVFEDALITLAHARNAALGLGLVHHGGEEVAVHGFTSALSVVIPLGGELIAPDSGLLVLRFVSLIAAALTVLVALQIAEELALGRTTRWFMVVFLAFNTNHVFYGMVGMETQIAVLALLASILLVVQRRSAVIIGLSLGATLLARPDFVLWAIAVLMAGLLTHRRRTATIALWSAITVAPWIVFTTFYYGSPIPNTIGAKSDVWGGLHLLIGGDQTDFGLFIDQSVRSGRKLLLSFAPFFDNSQVIRAPVPFVAAITMSIIVFVFAVRGGVALRSRIEWWPVLGFVAAYSLYRLFALPDYYFDWYVPPYTAVLIVLAAKGIDTTESLSDAFKTGVALVLSVAVALPLPWVIGLERNIASDIDAGVRVPMARYLDSVANGDTVVAESAGFIGYYSGVVLWDYPGLTSRTSRDALEGIPNPSLERLIVELEPNWLVLRPFELDDLHEAFPDAAARYELIRRFGREPTGVVKYGRLIIWSIDESFLVLRLDPAT